RALGERAGATGEREFGESGWARDEGESGGGGRSRGASLIAGGAGSGRLGWRAARSSARSPRWSWRSSAGWAAAAAIALVAVIIAIGPPRSADLGAQLVN